MVTDKERPDEEVRLLREILRKSGGSFWPTVLGAGLLLVSIAGTIGYVQVRSETNLVKLQEIERRMIQMEGSSLRHRAHCEDWQEDHLDMPWHEGAGRWIAKFNEQIKNLQKAH